MGRRGIGKDGSIGDVAHVESRREYGSYFFRNPTWCLYLFVHSPLPELTDDSLIQLLQMQDTIVFTA